MLFEELAKKLTAKANVKVTVVVHHRYGNLTGIIQKGIKNFFVVSDAGIVNFTVDDVEYLSENDITLR